MVRTLGVIAMLALVGVAITGAVVAFPGSGVPNIMQSPTDGNAAESGGSADIEITDSQ